MWQEDDSWDLHTVVFMWTHSLSHESTQTIFIEQEDSFRLVCFFILLLFFRLLEDVKDKQRAGKCTREKTSDYESVFLRVLCWLTAVLQLRFHSPVCHRKLNQRNQHRPYFYTDIQSLCRFNFARPHTVLYLSDRHTTHTGVQYTCPCVGTHLTGEGELLPPSNTIGLHRLPGRGNDKHFDSKHVQVRLYGACVECCVLEDNTQREKTHTHWQN